MPAGLQVFNDFGSIQIDADYRNLVLVKSGQFTANAATTAQDLWWSQNISVWQSATPFAVLAIKADFPNKVVAGPGSYRDGLKVCNFNYPQGGSSTFQYYIYDLVPPLTSDRSGMQIFNALGELVYSALDYPLKIIKSVSTRFPDPSASGSRMYVAPHPNVAYIGTGGGLFVDQDGVDIETTYMRTYWQNSVELMIELVHYANDYPTSITGEWGMIDQFGMVVDVTNVPKNYMRGQ